MHSGYGIYLLIYIFDKYVQLYEKHMLLCLVGEVGSDENLGFCCEMNPK